MSSRSATSTIDVQKGEFVFLVGPSGSGKSTFLRLLLREELPTAGRIVVAGRDITKLGTWKVPQLRRNIGCIFQDYKLLPNKTIYENVAFALRGDRPSAPRHARPGSADPRPRRASARRPRTSPTSSPVVSSSGSRSPARS